MPRTDCPSPRFFKLDAIGPDATCGQRARETGNPPDMTFWVALALRLDQRDTQVSTSSETANQSIFSTALAPAGVFA